MRGMLAPIPCLVAPLALVRCTGRVVAVACAEPAPVRLIDPVPARDRTTAGLAASARLRRGFIREPSAAVEIESCRPSFILGEVAAPGQYPYLPNMTAESADAIAGFSPRARRDRVTLTRTGASGPARFVVPSGTPLSPGDTVLVGERGF
jgi:polysaccharide export outer membrane protein